VALDPSPYNSHSSGIDTLWAGVPMVTLLGETFAGRVGASLVTAAGLPECVTHSWDEYLGLCVDLYNNPQRLQELRARLVAGRRTAPLFDMNLFVRSLEDLYFSMWEEKQTAGVDWPA
jgi:predicted O-linked N-acetylglucosamine transferase (SPINDLY family)